ncbi:MAG: efflux RND transporter periplasmic adaptor subunit [Sulfuricurvum sp.]
MLKNLLLFFTLVLLAVVSFKYIDLKNSTSVDASKIASSNGRIEASQVDIASKISGRLLEVYVSEGDFVEKNQAIAKLDAKELEAKYRVALSMIDQAKESKNYQLALLDQRQSELDLASKNFERAKTLYKNAGISQLTYQQDETAYNSSKASLEAVKASILSAEASIESAISEAEVIKTNLDESTLYTPTSGRVLHKLHKDGEMITSGERVAVVLDVLDTYMNIFLPTAEAGRVSYDTPVRIVLDAYPDVALPAKISFISPQAQFTPKQIETKDEREKLMFRLKASIDYDLLKKYVKDIRVGLSGVAYVKLDASEEWPQFLQNVAH